MDSVQKFISENQHQFGYIMHEASRQWIAKDKVGALTVGDCNLIIEKYGQYHEILEKMQRYEEALKFYADESNHESPIRDEHGQFNGSLVDKDEGEIARKALGSY